MEDEIEIVDNGYSWEVRYKGKKLAEFETFEEAEEYSNNVSINETPADEHTYFVGQKWSTRKYNYWDYYTYEIVDKLPGTDYKVEERHYAQIHPRFISLVDKMVYKAKESEIDLFDKQFDLVRKRK